MRYCWYRPTTSAASRSVWRRLRRGCARRRRGRLRRHVTRAARRRAIAAARAGRRSICRCTPRRGWRRRSSTRPARRIRGAAVRRTACTRRSTRRGCASTASTTCWGPKPRRSLTAIWRRRQSAGRQRRPDGADRELSPRRAFISTPDRAGCRLSHATRRCRCPTAPRAWSAAPTPRAAASISAGIVRSCRSTADVPRRSGRCGPRRHPRAGRGRRPAHHASAIRISSTARRTPAGLSSALARSVPGVTYDVTIKIEHLLQHAECCRCSRDTGCLFVTSAVESIDDAVLRQLAKGHTRADFVEAVSCAATPGVTLSPTFVAFTPWTTLEGYVELLRDDRAIWISSSRWRRSSSRSGCWSRGFAAAGAAGHPRSSSSAFDPASLTWPWRHRDPRVDALQRQVMRARRRQRRAARAVFDAIAALATERAGCVAVTPCADAIDATARSDRAGGRT